MNALRILVVGNVNGQFAQCFERVNTVNRKAGPFDMLLCCGDFFGEKTVSHLVDTESDFTLPTIPTYILGPVNQQQIGSYKKQDDFEPDFDAGFELCDGITFLGKKGILTGTSGLKIAYLSGQQSSKSTEYTFNEEDVKYVIMAAKSSSTLIDVLITSQWPTDIERYLQVCPPGVRAISENGSQLISKLAYFIKPRYHFTSSSLFFERQPYRNHQVIQEMAKHVTRFISLADVGNKNKAKWIYAFNITPSHKIPRNELIKQSTDTTECPFTGLEYLKEQRDSESEEKPNQYFYDMSQNNNSYFGGKRRRGRHHDDPGKRKNDDKPKDPCWFCLASPDVEKHLIVSIGDHSYLAMAKGGLVDDHLLIIPIAHFRSMLEVAESDSNVLVEINKFKTALHDYFIKQDKIAVYFERNFRSSHLQIQVVPVPVNKSRDLKELLLELSEERDFKLNEVNEDLELKDVLSTGVPYFYIEIPAAKIKLFCKINAAKGFPLQFGRELLAHPRVLNLGDRIDWKDCVLDRNTAEEVTAQFRKNFEPFDFTL